jgi:hypothetical protein
MRTTLEPSYRSNETTKSRELTGVSCKYGDRQYQQGHDSDNVRRHKVVVWEQESDNKKRSSIFSPNSESESMVF